MPAADVTPARIGVVMPAYNAERTLHRTYADLPHELVSEVILVDDASSDRTVELARSLPISVFVHDRNRGYGANQKTCYREAVQRDLDVIVMLHPDYQYDPKLLPKLVEPILAGEADVVFGSRMVVPGEAYANGMPWWKVAGNVVLTQIENLTFGLSLSEFHTGYRAFHRRVLEALPIEHNSDAFIFDQEIVAQIVNAGFRIGEVHVPARYAPDASSVGFVGSCVYGLSILRLVAEYGAYRAGFTSPPRYRPP